MACHSMQTRYYRDDIKVKVTLQSPTSCYTACSCTLVWKKMQRWGFVIFTFAYHPTLFAYVLACHSLMLIIRLRAYAYTPTREVIYKCIAFAFKHYYCCSGCSLHPYSTALVEKWKLRRTSCVRWLPVFSWSPWYASFQRKLKLGKTCIC